MEGYLGRLEVLWNKIQKSRDGHEWLESCSVQNRKIYDYRREYFLLNQPSASHEYEALATPIFTASAYMCTGDQSSPSPSHTSADGQRFVYSLAELNMHGAACVSEILTQVSALVETVDISVGRRAL